MIGVVENMTGELPVGGGDAVAGRLDVPVLARIPLSVPLREGGESRRPRRARPPVRPGAAAAILSLADILAARGRDLTTRTLPLSPR